MALLEGRIMYDCNDFPGYEYLKTPELKLLIPARGNELISNEFIDFC
jgi:hypothetical protein